jgi:MraZ protein
MSFRGSALRNLDPKGRLMLPPDFREALVASGSENKLVLSLYDGCVTAYPLPLWKKIEEQLSLVNNPSRQMRDFKRTLIGNAMEVELDNQGRINIPRTHMDYAQLARDIVVVGQIDRFEIWDQAHFNQVTSQDFDIGEELARNGVEISL